VSEAGVVTLSWSHLGKMTAIRRNFIVTAHMIRTLPWSHLRRMTANLSKELNMNPKDLFERTKNRIAAGLGMAKEFGKTLGGTAGVEEIRGLRADQEQLNLALAVRLKDLQTSTVQARDESAKSLRIAEGAAAEVRDAVADLARRKGELDATLASAHRLELDVRQADAQRAVALQALERWLVVLALACAVLVILVAWILARGPA